MCFKESATKIGTNWLKNGKNARKKLKFET